MSDRIEQHMRLECLKLATETLNQRAEEFPKVTDIGLAQDYYNFVIGQPSPQETAE